MAPNVKKTLRRLQSLGIIKVAFIIIVCSGVYLFVMVHQIENSFMRTDLYSPIIYEPESQWNDSYVQLEGVGNREEISDLLENDDAFKDLLNFDAGTVAGENVPTTHFPSLRISRFRKGPNAHVIDTGIDLKQKEHFNSPQDVSISQVEFQRNVATIDFRRLSNSYRNIAQSKVANLLSSESQSDSEPQPETTKSSRRFINDQPQNLGMEHFKQHLSYSRNGSRKNLEQQSKSSHLPKGKIKPKNAKEEETYLTESQSDFQQEKPYKEPSSNRTDHLASTSNFSTITQDNLKEKPSNRTSPPRSEHNDSVIGNNVKFSSLDTRRMFLNNSNPEKRYSRKKPVSNRQGKPTLRVMIHNSNRLQQSTLEKQTSNRRRNSSKVASNRHSRKAGLKVMESNRDSEQLPNTSSLKKRRSLLIFGDDRSGTTFVTKMFAADPQMFTVYEPLWVTKKEWFSKFLIGSDLQVKLTLDVVNALLSCQFTHSKAGTKFLAHTSKTWVGPGVFEKNIFRTSPFANKTKTGKLVWPNLYRNPEFAEEVCLKKFKHNVVKVGQIRVPRESISAFIPRVFHANPDTDIRIIQIVRDPRGSLNSRIRNGWISDFTYVGFPKLVRKMCAKIEANIQFGRDLKPEWKERYMEITYREITTIPITTAKKMYKFAGFEMPDSLIDWIVKSTNPEEDQLEDALKNPYSHVRDSRKNDLKWRKESPIKRVRIIEQQCEGLLNLLGLDPVADELETLRA